MKKLYEMPAIELTKFDVEDVITASTGLAGDAIVIKETDVNTVARWDSSWNATWIDANI